MRPGDVVQDRFKLDQLAGSGGMGAVFRARDRHTGDVVAIKILNTTADDRMRFEREARVLATLDHPGIVRYIAHGLTAEGTAYLAMEWLEGEDLHKRLQRERLNIRDSLAITLRAAEALAVAHTQGITHRDLKPSNLFLVDGNLNQVKVVDFGIASLGGATRVTQTGALLGTPGYMAPEQIQNEILTPQADVFALGCVLFECLSGTPAFTGQHAMAVLAKVLFQETPRVSDFQPHVPPELEVLLERMLAKHPHQRPRDGEAVVAEIQALGRALIRAESAPTLKESEPISLLPIREQKVLSVVLIGKDPLNTQELQTARITRLQKEIRDLITLNSGRFESLSDGSMIVTISAMGIATDQATSAARCALSLQALGFRRPMALATGRAEIVNSMPTGDIIDRAARCLLQLSSLLASWDDAATWPIAIDDVTAGLLDARFDIRQGASGHLLVGEHDIAEGTRTLLGKLTPCVGRVQELHMLQTIFTKCLDESVAHCVLVTAPAGIGKSRLAYEFLCTVRKLSEPIEIWMGRGDSLRAGSPFGLLRQALRGACAIRDGEPLEARQMKLRTRVERRVPPRDHKRVTEFLAEIMGLPFPDQDSAPLRAARQDAQLMGEQMRRAWEDFVRAECATHPVLLVLEDLHWGDLPTVRFVDASLRSQKDRPFMVLSLARPEVHEIFPKLWFDRELQEVRLKGLTRKASRQLVEQVLGNSVSAQTLERLVEHADGNAFYLEELIRATAERRGETLPETVVAMVQSRLSGLEHDARRILRAASVFGEVFWEGGVAHLLGGRLPLSQAVDWMSTLVEKEVLVYRADSLFLGEREFAFRHALLREGAYAMLPDEYRVLGHRLAGEWLELHGEDDALVLAEHYDRGRERSRAGSFYLLAAEQAHRAGDPQDTLARIQHGIARDLPEAARIGLLGLLCEVHAWKDDTAAAVAHVDEIMRLARPGSTPWARALTLLLIETSRRGEFDVFMAALDAVKDAEASAESTSQLAEALMIGILVLDSIGKSSLADSFVTQLHDLVTADDQKDPTAQAWMYLTHAFRNAAVKEDPYAGLRSAELTQDKFLEAEHLQGALMAQMCIGMNLLYLGEIFDAERVLGSIADEQFGLAAAHRTISLVGTLIRLGSFDEARQQAERLIETATRRSLAIDEGRGHLALADVLYAMGQLQPAEEQARIAMNLLANLPPEQTAAMATAAAIVLAQDRAIEALDLAKTAMANYASFGCVGFFRGSRVHLVLAESLHAAGHDEQARHAIAQARDRLLDIANKIDDEAIKQDFWDKVPENARTRQLAHAWLKETP